jgi:hypothetical protein
MGRSATLTATLWGDGNWWSKTRANRPLNASKNAVGCHSTALLRLGGWLGRPLGSGAS